MNGQVLRLMCAWLFSFFSFLFLYALLWTWCMDCFLFRIWYWIYSIGSTYLLQDLGVAPPSVLIFQNRFVQYLSVGIPLSRLPFDPSDPQTGRVWTAGHGPTDELVHVVSLVGNMPPVDELDKGWVLREELDLGLLLISSLESQVRPMDQVINWVKDQVKKMNSQP